MLAPCVAAPDLAEIGLVVSIPPHQAEVIKMRRSDLIGVISAD